MPGEEDVDDPPRLPSQSPPAAWAAWMLIAYLVSIGMLAYCAYRDPNDAPVYVVAAGLWIPLQQLKLMFRRNVSAKVADEEAQRVRRRLLPFQREIPKQVPEEDAQDMRRRLLAGRRWRNR